MKNYDILQDVAEWAIVISLLFLAAHLFFGPPNAIGPLVDLTGSFTAKVVYFIGYFGEAAVLIATKYFKLKVAHKNILLIIYLTGTFTFFISFVVRGVTLRLLAHLIIGIASGACWLSWKIKISYIDPKKYKDITDHSS